jgi:nucleotide-binding universal stress UspA family protein
MTVRSIVTFVQPDNIATEPDALQLALAWAAAAGAQVIALAFPVDVTADEADFSTSRDAIAAIADQAGVACTVVDRSSFAEGIGEVFADQMKVADLGILRGRTGPRMGERLLAESALFGTYRPLVLAPRQPVAGLPGRALIAWDGTHAAARAMQGALALLPVGAEAIVAGVTEDKLLRADQSGNEAALHLSRHGLKAEFREIAREGRAVFDVLTAAAAEAACDLIVAGAIRHSPIHELMFGSVTSKMLAGDCDLPVLLSA